MEEEFIQLRLGHLFCAESGSEIFAYQFCRVKKLVDIVDICAAGLFAAFVGHFIQHALRLVAHDAEYQAEYNGNCC